MFRYEKNLERGNRDPHSSKEVDVSHPCLLYISKSDFTKSLHLEDGYIYFPLFFSSLGDSRGNHYNLCSKVVVSISSDFICSRLGFDSRKVVVLILVSRK